MEVFLLQLEPVKGLRHGILSYFGHRVLGFGRMCPKEKKHIVLLAVLSFLEIMPRLCFFLKIMLFVTKIMLLRF